MNECPRCGAVHESASLECQSCGLRYSHPLTEFRQNHPIRAYFGDVWVIIATPSQFFKGLPLKSNLGHPLTFALVTHWIGTSVGFIWQQLWASKEKTDSHMSFSWSQYQYNVPFQVGKHNPFAEFQKEYGDKFVHWFWGTGHVIADPFYTLAAILLSSFFVYLGARILVTPGKNDAPSEITYTSVVRVLSYATAPAILMALIPLPKLGWFVAHVGVLWISVIGVRETYRTNTGKALLIALFPKLLFIGMILVGLLVLLVGVLKLLF